MSNENRRVNAILIPKAEEALGRTVNRVGLSKTDVINRALQVYAFIEDELASGAQILVKRGDSTTEMRFL